MDHVRIDPKFRRKPRPKRAGWAAREVFKFLLEVSAEFDLHGRFSPSMQDVAWLTDEWVNGDESARDYAALMLGAQLPRLVEVGLLTRDAAELVITDWEDFYKPAKPNAQRQADWRARNAAPAAPLPVTTSNASVTAVTEPVTRNASNESNATTQHSTTQHSTKGEAAPPPPVPAAPKPPPPATSAPTTAPEGPGTLRDRLEATFQRVKRAPYRWRTQDDNAVRELLAAAADNWGEVDRRWALALARARFPTCSSVPELAKHWNAYATDEPKAPKDKGRFVNAQDAQHTEKVGVVDGF
jgi:hypothetical protein